MATTKAFELAQLSAGFTSTTGVASLTDALDVNGAEILVGTNNSRFAENNLRFMATGASYIDVNTVGQALNFRVSESSSLDTTAISIADDGKVTIPNLIGNTTIEKDYSGTYPSATSRVLTLKNTNTTSDSVTFGLRTTAGGTGSVAKTIDFINTDGTLVLRTSSNSTGTLADPFELDNSQLNITPTTTSTSTTTGAIITAGGVGIAENLNVGGNVTVSGDLTVEGTSVTLNTTDLNVEDKNITLNYHATADTSASAGGAGITIQDAVDSSNDASILWDATNDKFTMSHGLTLLSANHLQFTRGGELRSTDTGGTIRTLVRVNGTNELEYGWSGAGPVKFMGGGSYAEKIRIHTDGNVGIGGVVAPVTALHVDPGYVTLGGSSGTDNSWINNVEDGNLELVNEGRSTNDGAVRINRKNNPAGDTTYFRDTVIYDGKSNVVLFVDGSEGKVGIGTDTPAEALHVLGASNQIRIEDSSNNKKYDLNVDGDKFMIDDMTAGANRFAISGTNIGIGTDNPETLLDVRKSSTAVYTSEMTGSASYVPSGADMIQVRNTNSGLDDIYAGIWFETGNPATNTTGTDRSGRIALVVDNDNAYSSSFVFQNRTTTGKLAENMRIAGNGNVGIGDTDPSALRLSVITPTANHVGLQVENSNTADSFGMIVKAGNDANDYIADFRQRDNTNIMRIRGDGNVGIGTGSPESKLHISGNSDVSDEDCMLIIDDVDGSAGSRIPAIMFRSVTGGTTTNQARIRGTDTQGIVMSGSAALGDDLVVQAGGVGIGTTSPAHKLDVVGAIGASQVRHSILPSLHLDFASSKHLDSRITFYRDSVGSYIDSTGVLRYASPNEPRFDHDISTKRSKGLLIEEQRENLFYYSSVIGDLDFASGWQNSGSNPIRQNAYAAVAPDGTATATLIGNLNNTNTDPDLYIYQSHNLNGGELITYSIWVKAYTSANVGKHVEIRGKRIGGTSASFGKVATLTSEWQRVEVSCQYNADNTSTARLYVGARSNYGNFTDDDGNTVSFDPASEALFWGAQAEEGAFATSYIPTRLTDSSRSSTATYQDKDGVLRYAGKNEPRYGYKWDGQKYAPVGLLVEPSVQQIAPQTETIGSAWYTTSYSKQDVRITLPNGTVGNAIKAIMDSGQSANATTALGFYIGAFTRQTGLVYNTSFFAKSNDENGLRIRDGLRTGAFLDINLNNGEIVANNATVFYDVMVEKYAHGWWRISYNYDSTSSGTGGWHAIRSYNNGDGSKGFLFWGAQLTTASYTQYNGLSSYIPNPGGGWGVVTRTADVPNGAPTTRYKDVAHLDDILYADWNNEEEGTFYTEYEVPYDIEDISINYRVLERHTEGTGQNVTSILLNSGTDQTNAGAYNNSAWQSLLGVTNSLGVTDKNVVNKLAFGFKDNDFGLSIQGSPIAQDSSGTVTRGATRLQLGSNSSLANTLNGHLKIVKFYPERLTNAELVALTENN